ncbi:transporter [Thermithiobacillus plumbiphilus]|uniref:Transporter n=1 Tax=Thermithiobacillus plumbiphilus TaxID=1729899 RepID=A0ABU9D7K9_9PROT
MNELSTTLSYILWPVAFMILGGIAAIFRAPGPRLTSAIQHFAAGVVFAAIAVELLPELVGEHAPFAVMVGFALGVLLMLGMKALTARLGAKTVLPAGGTASPLGLVATVAIDVFIDGLLIGVGFAAGAEQGKMLTFALTLELLFLGLSAASSQIQAGVARARVVGVTLLLGGLVALGASIGILLLGGLKGPILAGVLAFGSAALLYLVTEELLVEAHEVPETPWLTAAFFLGFLVFLELGMAV